MIFMRFTVFFLCLFAGMATGVRADLMVVQTLENLQDGKPVNKEQVTMCVSGRRIRLDQGQSFTSLILAEKKVTFSISHEARKYIVLAHDLVDVPKDEDGDSLTGVSIEPTGATEVISGFACRQVRLKNASGGITELWISNDALDMGTFYKEFKSFMEFGQSASPKQMEKHPELKGVPIRVVEYHQGKSARRATIVQLSTAKIPVTMFEVPAGYSEMKPSDFSPLPPIDPPAPLPK